MKKTAYVILSPRKDVPPHGELTNLDEVRQFLGAHGITILDDRGWVVVETQDGKVGHDCHAAILVSDQGADAKSIAALALAR